MVFAQSPTIFWCFTGITAFSLLILVIWYFEPACAAVARLFASSPSALSDEQKSFLFPEPLYANFFLGASDQRSVEITIGKKAVCIWVEQELESVPDPQKEMEALVAIVTEIYGGFTPWASAYRGKLERERAEAVSLLADAGISLRKANDQNTRLLGQIDRQSVRDGHIESLKRERAVADAKINELVNANDELRKIIVGQKSKMDDLVKDNDLNVNAAIVATMKWSRAKRWVAHFKEAFKQKRSSLAGVEYELAHRRQEIFDMKDDRLKLSELLLSMGQRIVKQAELLAKRAENKPTHGG